MTTQDHHRKERAGMYQDPVPEPPVPDEPFPLLGEEDGEEEEEEEEEGDA